MAFDNGMQFTRNFLTNEALPIPERDAASTEIAFSNHCRKAITHSKYIQGVFNMIP